MPNLFHVFSRLLLGMALMTSITVAAQQSGNAVQKKAEAELLSLHREERRAHFDHDVQFLLTHVAPHLLDVRDGRVNRMSSEDVRHRFQDYFKHAQFSAWDDVEPPVVCVSPDGQMGWMIVRVQITYTETGESGNKTNQSTVGAWMSAYQRRNGKWIMTAVASTFGHD